MIILYSAVLGIHLAKHGKEKEKPNNKYDFGGALFVTALVNTILYFGGGLWITKRKSE
jgi:hypothetical protein